MKKLMKHMKWDVILTSLLYVVLGVAALVMPDTMIKTLGYLIGAFLIIAGAVSMICYLLRDARQNYFRNDFVYGLVGITIGIIVLYQIEGIVKVVPVILGVLVVASGCRKLQDVIDMKRMEYGNWAAMLILAAANVVFGVVLILNPFEVVERLIGVGLIVSGVADCAIALYFAGKIQKYMDRVQTVDGTYVEIRGAEDKKTEVKSAGGLVTTPDKKPGAAGQNSPDKKPGAAGQSSPDKKLEAADRHPAEKKPGASDQRPADQQPAAEKRPEEAEAKPAKEQPQAPGGQKAGNRQTNPSDGEGKGEEQ